LLYKRNPASRQYKPKALEPNQISDAGTDLMTNRKIHTTENLRSDLRLLGVKTGYDLIVHASLKSLGKVEGGYRNFLDALFLAIGDDGTIIAPAFYYGAICPSEYRIPPPPDEIARIQAKCRPFDEHLSPSQEGSFGEMVRLDTRGFRSLHPVISWAAIGTRAKEYTEDVPLDDADGLDSPLGQVYKRGKAQILLVGVDHIKNTSLHLAESLAGSPHYLQSTTRYLIDDNNWGTIKGIGGCSGGFHKIRGLIDFVKYEIKGKVGDSLTILIEQKPFVDAARDALIKTPHALLCDNPSCRDCSQARELYVLEPMKEREYHIRKPYLD
jgi:aminoglycoside 3-N-acetyltransferase